MTDATHQAKGGDDGTDRDQPTVTELDLLDAYWRAANYLSVGQIYLLDNPLLREPLQAEHVKPRLLGHFGTTPGLNFVYAHLNRAIKARDLSMIYVTGPGHGGPGSSQMRTSRGRTASSTRTSARTSDGLRELFRQFSFPGGIPSHVAPETPGSIHEGGELGYALVARVRRGVRQSGSGRRVRRRRRRGRDRPARDELALEQVPRSAHGRRGAADPASERLQDREPDGARADPRARAARAVRGLRLASAPGQRRARRPAADAHHRFAAVLDEALDEIRAIQSRRARATPASGPRWPMIVLRSPKGWTGPREVDGVQVEGTWRSHQVPLGAAREDAEHRAILETLAAQLPPGRAVRRIRPPAAAAPRACSRPASGA